MNSLLVSYTVFGNPRVRYQNVTPDDLCGPATLVELLCGWDNFPVTSAELKVLDVIPQ